MNKMTDWIQTFTGKKFYPLEPDIESIDIIDIGHALSNTCRFNGHCREFYSVAQHSLFVAERLKRLNASDTICLAGLLHDASEAYLCDLVRPVKHDDSLSRYREIENVLQDMIYKKFGITLTDSQKKLIKEIDGIALSVEANLLFNKNPEWNTSYDQILDKIDGLTLPKSSPSKTESDFLTTYMFYC